MARLKLPLKLSSKKVNEDNSDCDLSIFSSYYNVPENDEPYDHQNIVAEFVQYQILIERWGTLSWRINELANQLRADRISESHFREKVREIVDEYAIKKIVE